jgi:hypothetical protein
METTTSNVPQKGDRITVSVLENYRIQYDRPMNCRPKCVCGDCDGRTFEVEGTIVDVIHWVDAPPHSYDLVVRCDDGQVRTRTIDVRRNA